MFKMGQQVKINDTDEIVTVEMTTEKSGYLSVAPGSRVFHASEVSEVCTDAEHDGNIEMYGCCDTCGQWASSVSDSDYLAENRNAQATRALAEGF